MSEFVHHIRSSY